MARKETFSDQIRRLYLESGLTRAELQTITGMTKSGISRFVNGERFLSEQVLNKLAAHFGWEIKSRKD
jgi:transcriptional regulator with XRE-family HTH domain